MTASVLVITVTLGGVGALVRLLMFRAMLNSQWWALGVVNCVGSAFVGAIFAFPESQWSLPLMVGLGGGLTTFSTLVLLVSPDPKKKVFLQIKENFWRLSVHIILGVLCCFIGLTITRVVA